MIRSNGYSNDHMQAHSHMWFCLSTRGVLEASGLQLSLLEDITVAEVINALLAVDAGLLTAQPTKFCGTTLSESSECGILGTRLRRTLVRTMELGVK